MPRVVKAYPPIYADIIKALPAVKLRRNAVFTYAPDIYHPAGTDLSYDLIEHEKTHIRQQEAMGVKEWWKRYLADPRFRLSQELEAYQVQFKAAQYMNRGARRVLLNKIAGDLSSAMYGKIITSKEAKEAITK